ncbi:glycosyltransferase family 2 protein, partial [Escherichia coli]|nr:glycosyltransferase family 2 protein [Escherichia coli]
ALGAGVHFLVLGVLFRGLAWPFVGATMLAVLAAMSFNFFLNNALTYREQRLKGGGALLAGWFSFCLVCSVGAAANVGVAAFLHNVQH